nr:uncharacterized protein CTRU02_04491 [Colletotrichum truncatum]KAF6795681.1 hypothetical protein CTRU02_04491 [Colletotrichum truncatum]
MRELISEPQQRRSRFRNNKFRTRRDLSAEYRFAYPFFISSCMWLRLLKSSLFRKVASRCNPPMSIPGQLYYPVFGPLASVLTSFRILVFLFSPPLWSLVRGLGAAHIISVLQALTRLVSTTNSLFGNSPIANRSHNFKGVLPVVPGCSSIARHCSRTNQK